MKITFYQEINGNYEKRESLQVTDQCNELICSNFALKVRDKLTKLQKTDYNVLIKFTDKDFTYFKEIIFKE